MTTTELAAALGASVEALADLGRFVRRGHQGMVSSINVDPDNPRDLLVGITWDSDKYSQDLFTPSDLAQAVRIKHAH